MCKRTTLPCLHEEFINFWLQILVNTNVNDCSVTSNYLHTPFTLWSFEGFSHQNSQLNLRLDCRSFKKQETHSGTLNKKKSESNNFQCICVFIFLVGFKYMYRQNTYIFFQSNVCSYHISSLIHCLVTGYKCE